MQSWVLVTGGSLRLGREIGLAFARAGWHVLCHYRHSAEAAQALCAQVRALGRMAEPIGGNLEGEAACEQVFAAAQAAVSAHGAATDLRAIVHNASLFEPDHGTDFAEAQALAQLQVNLLAPMYFGKWLHALHASAQTTGAPHPSLVHVLDQKVYNLNPDYFSYTLSKLALERAVGLQAQSLAPVLRVNAVAPGLLYPSGPQSEENYQRAARVNLLREPINPVEVAEACVYLAQARGITGTALRVDNGQHLVPLARDVMFAIDQGLTP